MYILEILEIRGRYDFMVFLYLNIVMVWDFLEVIICVVIFLVVIMFGGVDLYVFILFLLILNISWGLFVSLCLLMMVFSFLKYFEIYFGDVVLVLSFNNFDGLIMCSLGYFFIKL